MSRNEADEFRFGVSVTSISLCILRAHQIRYHVLITSIHLVCFEVLIDRTPSIYLFVRQQAFVPTII